MKKAAAIAALLFASSAAHATDWYNVGGNQRTQTYVDADSIRQIGDKTQVWSWSVYAQPLHDGQTYSARIKSEYDCAASYFRTLEYVYFGPNAKYLKTEASETINERKYPAPDSINESLMAFVCKRVGGTKAPNPLDHAAGQFASN